jgi:N-acetylglucosamine-6-phosphate deacetylase
LRTSPHRPSPQPSPLSTGEREEQPARSRPISTNPPSSPLDASTSVTAIHYATTQPIRLHLQNGKIQHIESLPPDPAADLPTLAPGLVDLQINGYAGRDFNSLPIAPDMVGEVIRLLWSEGVTSCYPTIITNSAQAIHEAMTAIAQACDADSTPDRGIAGIHLEGPFISPEDGARGAHARQFVQPPDWDNFRRWQDASGNRIRITTMSPEWPHSADFIARCAASGVTVSIGHTSATPEQIRDAVAAGARMSTHLGNGAHLMLPRHPNYIWEQLAQDNLWSCLIADGFHLPDQVLKVVMRVKGDRALLVSDAISLAGLPPGTYTTHVGGRVVLTATGRTHLADNEKILAGSAQMLLHSIEHVTSRKLADFATAWDMSSTRPAGFMHLPAAAGLAPGAPADFVLLRRDGSRVRVEGTYKAGMRVYSAV